MSMWVNIMLWRVPGFEGTHSTIHNDEHMYINGQHYSCSHSRLTLKWPHHANGKSQYQYFKLIYYNSYGSSWIIQGCFKRLNFKFQILLIYYFRFLARIRGAMVWWLRRRFPNPGVPCSRSLGGSNIDLPFLSFW